MKKLNLSLFVIGLLFTLYGLYQAFVVSSLLSLYQGLNVASPKNPYLIPLVLIIVGIIILAASLLNRKKQS